MNNTINKCRRVFKLIIKCKLGIEFAFALRIFRSINEKRYKIVNNTYRYNFQLMNNSKWLSNIFKLFTNVFLNKI